MKKRIQEFSVHQRHLPHWQLPGATYHVVCTLQSSSICDLSRDNIAPIILKTLAHHANCRHFLYDHTVMPDHVHVILQPIEKDFSVEPLGDILGDIKSYTARSINKVLGRNGSLWLDESFDRIMRDEAEYKKVAQYILENPVRAGLVH